MGQMDTRRRRLGRLLPALLGFALVAGPWAGAAGADPSYLVDTGPGASSGGLSLTPSQYLAGQFTLDEACELAALEGWMLYLNIVNSLPVYAVLYGDGDGVPDLDDEIHRELFFVPPSGFVPGWHGVDGLSVPVYPGTYWLAFEVDPAAIGSGAMPPTPLPELDRYATGTSAGYLPSVTAQIGIRVLPEPASAVSLAAGMLALLARARVRGHVA